MTPDNAQPPRTYVRRQGRMTAAQALALAAAPDAFILNLLANRSQLEAGGVSATFGRGAPLLVEIGFGMGHALIDSAVNRPDWNVLGVEVYRPGIGAVLKRARDLELTNLRVIEGDAVLLLRDVVEPASIDELQVLFPDPWPKLRHHKRRLIQPAFAELAVSRLKVGGRWCLATDWQPYAAAMLDVLEHTPGLVNAHAAAQYAPGTNLRNETRFERRGKNLGHAIRDFEYQRCS